MSNSREMRRLRAKWQQKLPGPRSGPLGTVPSSSSSSQGSSRAPWLASAHHEARAPVARSCGLPLSKIRDAAADQRLQRRAMCCRRHTPIYVRWGPGISRWPRRPRRLVVERGELRPAVHPGVQSRDQSVLRRGRTPFAGRLSRTEHDVACALHYHAAWIFETSSTTLDLWRSTSSWSWASSIRRLRPQPSRFAGSSWIETPTR